MEDPRSLGTALQHHWAQEAGGALRLMGSASHGGAHLKFQY